MLLAPISESLVNGEDHSWLASKHGLDAPKGCMLDGAAWGAIYTDGIVKSGSILAKNTSTGRYVPYDQATSANGLNVAAGFLFTSIKISDGLGNFFNSPAAILYHGQVYTALLPRSAAQTGGPHAEAVATLTAAGFKFL